MSTALLEQMMLERAARKDPWDRRPSGRSVCDVAEATLRRFVKEGNACGRIEMPFTDAKEVLSRLGLIADNGTLTNAASVLFCPSRTGARLKMGILADRRRVEILDLQQGEEPVYDLIGRAEFYILSNIRRRFVIDGNPSRVELPEIPRAAFREAVVNAFCHRDFTDYGTAVQVDIYPDAVDITNPGAFPLGRTPEMYLSEMVVAPRSRNPLIATTLFRSKVVEAFGSGIRRIRDTCEEAGVRFEYMQGPDTTTLRFYRNDPYDVMHTGQSPAEAVQAHLSQGAAKALKTLENEDGHTAASLAVELGISAR